MYAMELLPAVDSSEGGAALARLHSSVWEECLGLRISLQKTLDSINSLPLINANVVSDSSEERKLLSAELHKLLRSLTSSFAANIHSNEKKNGVSDWEEIRALTLHAREKWSPVIDKWQARLSFGSELAKAKMKVFSSSFFESIDASLKDEDRVIEKVNTLFVYIIALLYNITYTQTRVLFENSPRLDKLIDSTDIDKADTLRVKRGRAEGDSTSEDEEEEAFRRRKRFDEEVYEDRQFYSLLLKTFLSSSSASSSSSSSSSRMKEDQLIALRRAGRTKNTVRTLCLLPAHCRHIYRCALGGQAGEQGAQGPLQGPCQATELHLSHCRSRGGD